MEIIVTNIITALVAVFCYTLGLKNGQKVINNEPIETPKIEPVKAIKKIVAENKQSKALNKEYEKIQTILQNIDAYDGTAKGQKKVNE